MLRLILGALLGALLIAPLGFGSTGPAPIGTVSRLVFAMLMLACVLFSCLSVFWSRRWIVEQP
jgi:hypothetical protein